MFDIENCVGFQISNAAKAIEEYLNDQLMPLGITRVQWIALYFIGRHPQSFISQSCLAKKLRIKSSTAARLVDRMERDHYVKRVKSSRDKRIIKLHLTRKGRMLREQVMKNAEITWDNLTKNIPQEDLEIFTRVLHTFKLNIHH